MFHRLCEAWREGLSRQPRLRGAASEDCRSQTLVGGTLEGRAEVQPADVEPRRRGTAHISNDCHSVREAARSNRVAVRRYGVALDDVGARAPIVGRMVATLWRPDTS